jgi:hypothetical protein
MLQHYLPYLRLWSGEYDSHDIDGVGTYTEACGQFVLEVTPG